MCGDGGDGAGDGAGERGEVRPASRGVRRRTYLGNTGTGQYCDIDTTDGRPPEGSAAPRVAAESAG